jgi:hypothetical protein
MFRPEKWVKGGLSPEETLAAAVIRYGLRMDGLDYLSFPCGSYWLAVLGFEAEAVWPMAVRGTDHQGFSYRSLPCRHARVVRAGTKWQRVEREDDWHEGFETQDTFEEYYVRIIVSDPTIFARSDTLKPKRRKRHAKDKPIHEYNAPDPQPGVR